MGLKLSGAFKFSSELLQVGDHVYYPEYEEGFTVTHVEEGSFRSKVVWSDGVSMDLESEIFDGVDYDDDEAEVILR